jgi:WD40 repeat protein
VWTPGNTARTWMCEQTITLHLPRVLSCLAVSSAAASIACGEMSGDVSVWDAVSGVCHTTLSGHTASVQVVWVDSDGLKLISAALDGTIKVWDALTLACVSTLDLVGSEKVRCMAVDGGRLFCGMKSTVVPGNRPPLVAVRVWDLGTLNELVPIRSTTQYAVSENIDVKQLLVNRGEVWASVNNELVVWRAPVGWMDFLSLWNIAVCILLVVIMAPVQKLVFP